MSEVHVCALIQKTGRLEFGAQPQKREESSAPCSYVLYLAIG